MPKMAILNNPKGYSVQSKGDSVDITMYGEIVKERPTDWWTGEPVEGDFIIEKEFLDDLNNSVKAGAKKIRLKLNSVGGDSLVSILIHNRIRELAAEGVEFTARVDGAAMSGASMIMCACDNVEVNPSSLIMVHKCWSFLWGALNADALHSLADEFDAYDKAAAAIYQRKTNLSETVLMHLMADTTFLTGREAKDKGFADTVLEDEEQVKIAASADRSSIYVNGRKLTLMGAKAPENIPVVAPSEEVANKNQSGSDTDTEGGNSMAKNLAELRAENPDLATAVETELRAAFHAEQPESNADELIANERLRMQEIDEIASLLSPDLVREAKYDKPCTAAELSLRAMKQQAQSGNAFMRALQEDAKASNTESVPAASRSEEQSLTPKTPEQLMAEARAAVQSITKKEA